MLSILTIVGPAHGAAPPTPIDLVRALTDGSAVVKSGEVLYRVDRAGVVRDTWDPSRSGEQVFVVDVSADGRWVELGLGQTRWLHRWKDRAPVAEVTGGEVYLCPGAWWQVRRDQPSRRFDLASRAWSPVPLDAARFDPDACFGDALIGSGQSGTEVVSPSGAVRALPDPVRSEPAGPSVPGGLVFRPRADGGTLLRVGPDLAVSAGPPADRHGDAFYAAGTWGVLDDGQLTLTGSGPARSFEGHAISVDPSGAGVWVVTQAGVRWVPL